MTTLHPLELTCPCCQHNFTSRMVGATNVMGRKTDFYPITMGIQPMPYYIHTCPACGYTAPDDGYEDQALDEKLKDFIHKTLAPRVKDEEPFPGRKWEFAALMAAWRGAPSGEIADLYLRAAWCCTRDGRRDEEIGYRRQAIEYFEKALQADGVSSGEAATLTYLIGELYRRIGDSLNASLWFDRVPAAAGQDPKNQRAVALALQQKTNPQEEL